VATDVFAERLRSLEKAGAVVHTELTHPVPAKVYDLTERGRQLAGIAGQLAQWGSSLLPDRQRPGIG
jgi:DNA-binding HxlR family transcriptional regulator